MGPTKHSTVMAEVMLETCSLLSPLNYINTFRIFLFFLISKHKSQWQTTMNRGLSYLKNEFTALVWKKKINPLPLVMVETNKVQKGFFAPLR